MNAEGGPESAREPGTTTAKAWREQRSTPLVLRSVRAAMGRTTLVARTPRMNECQEMSRFVHRQANPLRVVAETLPPKRGHPKSVAWAEGVAPPSRGGGSGCRRLLPKVFIASLHLIVAVQQFRSTRRGRLRRRGGSVGRLRWRRTSSTSRSCSSTTRTSGSSSGLGTGAPRGANLYFQRSRPRSDGDGSRCGPRRRPSLTRRARPFRAPRPNPCTEAMRG